MHEMSVHSTALHRIVTHDPIFDDVAPNGRRPMPQPNAPLPQQVAVAGGRWDTMTAEERVDTIVKMDADGMSKREIADELETTRSAIAGFAFHHRLRLRTSVVRMHSGPPMIAAPEVSPTAWSPLPGSAPRRLADTGVGDCMWPVEVDGSQLFCCAPRSAGSYCARHAKMGGKKVSDRGEDPAIKRILMSEEIINTTPLPVAPEELARILGVVQKTGEE